MVLGSIPGSAGIFSHQIYFYVSSTSSILSSVLSLILSLTFSPHSPLVCSYSAYSVPLLSFLVCSYFLSLNHTPDLRVGKIQHLVFSDKDEKYRRSRVHVAHVKDPLVVENRKE